MKETKQEHKGKGDRTKEEKQELVRDVEAKVKAVLTPEQQKRFDELKAQAKQKIKKQKDI